MPPTGLNSLLAQEPAGVIEKISTRDAMYEGDPRAYAESGLSALRSIRLAMLAVGKRDVARIMDFPCGHGRSLRVLKAAFPAAELIAADIDPDAIEFCARVLGATPLQSGYSPPSEAPQDVDLIWCGSLLTHLDSPRWNGFLGFFERSLGPGGLLVFTTHGHAMADQLRTVTVRDFARPVENLLADHERYGFAYSDYYDAPKEYGVSLSSPAWVCRELRRLPGLGLVLYTEAGWHSAQDLVACVKGGPPDPLDSAG
jgi:trans-aconitate methyltransferase